MLASLACTVKLEVPQSQVYPKWFRR